MAISERRRLTFTAIAVILVGIVTGLLLGSVLTSGAAPTKTFNIVTYSWGFALYDEDWNEIEQMEVERGTRVRLVAYPTSVFSATLREQFEQRVVAKGFGEYQPGDPQIASLIAEICGDALCPNHSVLIEPLGIDLKPRENASTLETSTASIEFTADAIGTFNIRCSVACGIGHPYMVLERAFVVK